MLQSFLKEVILYKQNVPNKLLNSPINEETNRDIQNDSKKI